MKRNRSVLAIISLIMVACCSIAQGDNELPRYSLKVITGVPLSPRSAKAINNKGAVLIWATDVPAKMHHSYLWLDGKVTDMGTLGGTYSEVNQEKMKFIIPGAIAYGLNDKNQAVGVSQAPDGNDHAFIWESGKMLDLGTLGGKTSEACDVNNLGQVVGYSDTAEGERHAFIWDQKGGMRDLGIPGKPSAAYRINDKGQVMGLSQSMKTFVWDGGKISYIEEKPLQDFGPFQGLNINDRGDIIGTVQRGGVGNSESRIFLWSGGKMIPVETTAKTSCNAFGLNSDGLVVGNAFDTPTGQHAFAWRSGSYSLANDLLTETGWNVYFSTAVNDRGEIAAAAWQGEKRGPGEVVVLTPVSGVKPK